MTESRIAQGLINLPALMAQAGLPESGWQAELVNSRRDAEGDRLVLRLTHPVADEVFLKQGFGANAERSMAAAVTAQRRAFGLLPGSGPARIPEILADLPGEAAFLMQPAPGTRLAEMVDRPGLPEGLQAAGAWLDAFHRSGPVEDRAFQPRFMLDHLSRLAAEASTGRRKIPQAQAFADTVTHLASLANSARNAATVSSHRHGDLNARNLLVGQGQAWGIDFSEAGQGPVGYDIARLLVHLVQLSNKNPVAGVVPGQMLEAFFSGYSLTGRRDGSLRFLFLARLLSDWASLAGDEADLTVFKAIRLERILQMAEAARKPS